MYKAILYFNNKVISEHKATEENPIISIGRRDTNSIHIDNAGVSGFHAQIKLSAGSLYYEDLDSTNGSFVDGIDIKTVPSKKVKLNNLSSIDITKYKILIKDMDIEKEVNLKKDLTAVKADLTEEKEYMATKVMQVNQLKNESVQNKVKASIQVLSGPDIGNTIEIVNKVTALGVQGSDSAIISERDGSYFIAKDGLGTVLINEIDIGGKAAQLTDNDIIKVGNIKMNFFFG